MADELWSGRLALTLSRIQSVVAILVGVVSVAGAAGSIVQLTRPSHMGCVVVDVRAAGSQRGVADATVEVLTADNALVATLKPDAAGA